MLKYWILKMQSIIIIIIIWSIVKVNSSLDWSNKSLKESVKSPIGSVKWVNQISNWIGQKSNWIGQTGQLKVRPYPLLNQT